jgi:hypothetical protein
MLNARLKRLRKKAECRHSERRFCAKNLSWSLVLIQEEFFASLSITNQGTFSAACEAVPYKYLADASHARIHLDAVELPQGMILLN